MFFFSTYSRIQYTKIHFRRELVVYLNAFSGDATTEFPSTLEMARGGVCCRSASFALWDILFLCGGFYAIFHFMT